jgi:hypothetical protein
MRPYLDKTFYKKGLVESLKVEAQYCEKKKKGLGVLKLP